MRLLTVVFGLLTTAVLSACASGASDPVDGSPTDAARTAAVSSPTVVADAADAADAVTRPTPLTAMGDQADGDPIAWLQSRIDAGAVILQFDTLWGYLPALLDVLDIPVSSQNLVFSRTSLQTDRIAPWTPRALYFNDEVYIGSVLESPFLEIASIDPADGAVFYTLPQDPDSRPSFQRETTTCLMCHESRTVTSGVPGLIMLSVLPDRHGWVVGEVHEGPTTDRTPFDRRWGGWYVTGTHATMQHSGNSLAPVLSHEVTDTRRYVREFDMHAESNVTDLEGRFDLEPYLGSGSDIVALMVLTHQVQVHNLITAAGMAARDALRDQDAVLRSSGRAAPEGGLLPTTRVRIDAAADRLVRAMLFSGEAALEGPVRGTTAFAEQFSARGRRDSRGRSLRDLDLDTRLMRYPLSFLIHSEAFYALPDLMKRTVFGQLHAVLEGDTTSDAFSHLSREDRRAIRQILEDTQPEYASVVGGS